MIESLALAKQVVIALAVIAAMMVTAGSWVRVKCGDRKQTLVKILNFSGYIFFLLSIAIFVAVGFSHR